MFKFTINGNKEVMVGTVEDIRAFKEMGFAIEILGNANIQPTFTTVGSSKKAEAPKKTKAEREAEREAEKTEFKSNHKLVASSKENKQKVYDEMKRQGITEFNRKDYERIAKQLGVLGKSGKVVATWEATK